MKDEQRTAELDIIIQKLYGKQLLDEVVGERFKKFCDCYEIEQIKLKEKLQIVTDSLKVEKKSVYNIEKFMASIRKYT